MIQDSLGYRSLQDLLRTRLRDGVIKGVYEPGQRLNINVLSKEFGVSAVPMREALRALEAEGFVDFSPNRGAVVKSFSKDEVREAFLIRIPLECLALREAIPRLTAEDFTILETLLKRLEKTTDLMRWLELNQKFHLTLYQRGDLPRLHQMLTLLWAVARPYLSVFVAEKMNRSKDEAEHRAILAACRGRDADAAVRILEKHLSDTYDAIVSVLLEDSSR